MCCPQPRSAGSHLYRDEGHDDESVRSRQSGAKVLTMCGSVQPDTGSRAESAIGRVRAGTRSRTVIGARVGRARRRLDLARPQLPAVTFRLTPNSSYVRSDMTLVRYRVATSAPAPGKPPSGHGISAASIRGLCHGAAPLRAGTPVCGNAFCGRR